jgi:hypothetical protein
MSRSRCAQALAVTLVALTCAGCWINSSAPRHAYALPDVDFRRFQPTPLPPPAHRRAVPQRMLVLPLWQNESPNPVGGLYDWNTYRVTPLQRTFFHPDISVPIWEGCADRLRASGFRAYKDYSDSGNAALVKRPARLAKAVLLRGRLAKALHDQLRDGDPKQPGVEAAVVSVDLELVSLSGVVLWRGKKDALLKVPTRPAPTCWWPSVAASPISSASTRRFWRRCAKGVRDADPHRLEARHPDAGRRALQRLRHAPAWDAATPSAKPEARPRATLHPDHRAAIGSQAPGRARGRLAQDELLFHADLSVVERVARKLGLERLSELAPGCLGAGAASGSLPRPGRPLSRRAARDSRREGGQIRLPARERHLAPLRHPLRSQAHDRHHLEELHRFGRPVDQQARQLRDLRQRDRTLSALRPARRRKEAGLEALDPRKRSAAPRPRQPGSPRPGRPTRHPPGPELAGAPS